MDLIDRLKAISERVTKTNQKSTTNTPPQNSQHLKTLIPQKHIA